jgi:hypothetical protein
LVSFLPKGQKWTSQCYIDHILPEIWTLRDARDGRKLVVHADNARPHVAKKVKQYLEDNNLKSAAHPPYSPDCSKGQNFRLQKSFSMRWFKFWLTFQSRSWYPHFTSDCRGSRHALTVMENMSNKHSLIQKTSVEFQRETEMLRGWTPCNGFEFIRQQIWVVAQHKNSLFQSNLLVEAPHWNIGNLG